MPLARFALYASGERIHLAPTADASDGWQATLRHIALEGRVFVIACNQYVTRADYPADFELKEALARSPDVVCRGGSAIIAPDGRYLAGPLYGEAGILTADLDLGDDHWRKPEPADLSPGDESLGFDGNVILAIFQGRDLGVVPLVPEPLAVGQ